jgi:hypothetical protein
MVEKKSRSSASVRKLRKVPLTSLSSLPVLKQTLRVKLLKNCPKDSEK